MNNQIKVLLENQENVVEFVKVSSKYSCDIDIKSIKYCSVLDAKSILGVMSMDLNNPLIVELITEDQNLIYAFKKDIQKFIVE